MTDPIVDPTEDPVEIAKLAKRLEEFGERVRQTIVPLLTDGPAFPTFQHRKVAEFFFRFGCLHGLLEHVKLSMLGDPIVQASVKDPSMVVKTVDDVINLGADMITHLVRAEKERN